MNSNLNTNAITNTKNTSSVEQNKRQDKIVICDDDKDIVRALEIYLSNRDYELPVSYTHLFHGLCIHTDAYDMWRCVCASSFMAVYCSSAKSNNHKYFI